MLGGYSDVNWFLRAARLAPVIAGAALLGGMIGGFAMFAIDSALTWEPTWEPVSQPRLDVRADSAASALVAQTTKPVRIVGGAIPDPSAGMSAPPPAPQQRNAAAQSPAQVSPQLLTPKPLGPASRLQPQTATAGPISGAPQQNQTANQVPVPTQAVTATQQPTRWPDALSRAHQNAANAANAANANSAQQQTAPPPTSASAASKNDDIDRKEASGDRAAATADDLDRAYTSRYGRHSRRHWRGDDDASAAPSPRRQDARTDAPTHDRLYDSSGNRRDRSQRNTREQSYGDAKGDQSGDQDGAASRSDLSRSEMRRLGREARYRGRSRAVTREQPEETDGTTDRTQTFEASRPQSEPFWGGGFFRRGDQDGD